MLDQLDKIANDYNKTKDPELKKLWLEKIKEWANGVHIIKDGTFFFGCICK